jgi:nucleotidyltransferase/DNA polymerase involved in DNA repair
VRRLHLLWTHLPLRLARARSDSFPTGPVILGGQPWAAGIVLDANPAATELGVQRGMALGSAHRLAPEATFLDPDPERDGATVEAALDRLAGFSPGIAGATDPADPTFGLLEVQVDGLDRLWGAEPVLVGRLVEALSPILPGPPRAGIAGTRFAATIAAATASPATVHPADGSPMIVGPGDEAQFLGPLPAGLLTPDPDIRARLGRFGLRRIEAVAQVPRSALVARFGEEGGRIHARATGEELEPFRPRRAPERMCLGIGLEPPIEELEPLRFVLHRLTSALVDQLVARGAATGRARLRLSLDPAFAASGSPTELVVEQRLPEPSSESEAIERLLFARLEREPPGVAVARLELELAEVAPATGQQLGLFIPQANRLARLRWQLARLALAFGDDRIGRVELADPEATLAEGRWTWHPVEVAP